MTTFHAVNIRDDLKEGPAQGYRVLVDRMWPRGVKKDDAALDERRTDLAPSADLRTWWNHDPERFDEFAGRYEAELDESGTAKKFLAECAERDEVILLFGAGDREVNHAVVLERILNDLAG
ncbi:DUF488 domain-containing protein [Cutibacterium namnetense]|uniref:PF04343 family protein n=1 Tax=[Propionibacterium] namnetense SK182B-JCVI TaxID=1051006 RepID=F9NW83_9ACTN|nr:DUF488 family protein [Cutibacterium namnetense]EGR96798.1 hypothetical protein HMPREF1162_1816 [ [[Propionibacterium] namnetense SK182B-JCVI]